jgi:nicotinamidase-related amidase
MTTKKLRRRSAQALLLIDFINPLDFRHDRGFVRRAVGAAARAAGLKRRLKSRGVATVYANDNFGGWTRDFGELVRICADRRSPARGLAQRLAPEPDDYRVLKPRHSAFFGTPLEFLLEELGVTTLILAGIAADNCVLFSASDAYVRKYRLWVPRDCVVSLRDEDRLRSLEHMRRVLKADVRSSLRGTENRKRG